MSVNNSSVVTNAIPTTTYATASKAAKAIGIAHQTMMRYCRDSVFKHTRAGGPKKNRYYDIVIPDNWADLIGRSTKACQPLSLEDSVYMASFIDGEGCITIQPNSDDLFTSSTMFAKVTNNDVPVLEWHRQVTGLGSIHPVTSTRAFQWTVGTQEAANVLKQIRPHFKIKGDQADLAMQFQAAKRQFGVRMRSLKELQAEARAYLDLRKLKLFPGDTLNQDASVKRAQDLLKLKKDPR